MSDDNRRYGRDDRSGGHRRDDERRGERRGGGRYADERRDDRRDDRGRQRSAARFTSAGHRSAQAPSERARRGDPARSVALEVLRAVSDGAYANLEMPKALRRAKVSGRDGAFATELALGTIRQQGFYDRIIEVGAGRPASEIDPVVLDVLRLGVHQLLSMRVPTHAAASETVALARQHAGSGAAGFVNAVLRRASERDRDTWVADLTRGITDPDEVRALATSHPVWIVSALRSALKGHEAVADGDVDAALDALLAADNLPPKVALVARPGLTTPEDLARVGAELSELSPIGAILPFGDPGELEAIRDTRAAVQDEGSQLLTLALLDAPVTSRGEGEQQEWLDMCAGPGGKAAIMGAVARMQGAALYCNEVSEHRTELVHRTLAAAINAGAEIYVGTGDGRELGADEPDSYDRVLLDAPCTGLGALRRRPESRWRREPADVSKLATLQRELLASALDAARPGGLVGYATCSPHPAETLTVINEVLAERDDVEQEDAWPYFRDAYDEPIARIGTLKSVQLWPHLHGTDAMFFALLRKK